MGVPLISRMRSPTWMEFFMSGLMQSGSTLQGPAGSGDQPPGPDTIMGGDVLEHCPQATPSQWGQAVCPLRVTSVRRGTCCHGTHKSPPQDGDVQASCPQATPAREGHAGMLPTSHPCWMGTQAHCPQATLA